MKHVESPQIIDIEQVGKATSQFWFSEEMKSQLDAMTVTKLDFTTVLPIVVTEVTRFLNRIYEDRGSAANRAHRGYQIAWGNARERCGDFRYACDRQMTEDTVEANR
jgi:hypothetical protein